jgi:hypothetical protein
MRKLIFILLLFASCQKEVIIPDDVANEVNEFYYHAERYGVKYKKVKGIYLVANLKNNYAGLTRGRNIYLDTTSHTYKVNKKRLVFHEMGHACLGRGDNEVPHKSIMNYFATDFKQNEEYYICELFHRTPCNH